MTDVRVGISGWNYPPWRGVFYPKGLRHKSELEYASHRFRSIEINGSFYSLLRPTSVERWVRETPDDFVFALKGSRFITHMKRLTDVKTALANFFGSGVLAFGKKLGPILWQLPASLAFEASRLESFFSLLPKTHGEAAKLARKHDARIDARAVTRTQFPSVPIRHVVEPRHPSFAEPEALTLFANHRVALCVADAAGIFPSIDEPTTDFTYVRLHGDTVLYESGYSLAALDAWATRIKAWKRRGDVYVYFDNDARVRAPFDALLLDAIINRKPHPKMPTLRGKGEPARELWPAWERAGTRRA